MVVHISTFTVLLALLLLLVQSLSRSHRESSRRSVLRLRVALRHALLQWKKSVIHSRKKASDTCSIALNGVDMDTQYVSVPIAKNSLINR